MWRPRSPRSRHARRIDRDHPSKLRSFRIAAKVPRVITDDKVMQDCDAELKEFLSVIDLLGDKLGPLLLQFPYFNRQAFARPEDFLARLVPFLKRLPSG